MKIDLELDEMLDELTRDFVGSPRKVNTAIKRSLRKLSRFAERRTLRELSRQQGITQKLLKELSRVKVSIYQPGERVGQGYSLAIWVGVRDIPAHYLGKTIQTPSGVQTGRHHWFGAFLMQPVNASEPMVFKRKEHWRHKLQRSKRSGRLMWMGLPLEKQTLPMYLAADRTIRRLQPLLLERFSILLQQELNYVFNIES